MRHIKDMTPQETSGAPAARRTLTALGRTTALALLGIELVCTSLFLVVWLAGHVVVLPILILALVAGLVAGFIATGVRWAPIAGVLVALVAAVLFLTVPLATSTLLHPGSNVERFIEIVILFACILVVIMAGAMATIQNYRSGERRAPRWGGYALTSLIGVVAGMIIVASIVAANPQSGSASIATSGIPTVHMAGNTFLTNVVLVPKGEKVLLVDDDAVEHIIQNGSWTQSGMPHPQEEPGAPVVHPLDLKGGSAQIGPFPTAGVFHLYCTIHQGMNLTIVVQ